jgi:hypothetical protein
MRTTVTLDPDLDRRLREVARQRRISFTAAVNAAIRAGLTKEPGRGSRYREVSRDLGVLPSVDLTKANRLAGALEDEATIAELGLRK